MKKSTIIILSSIALLVIIGFATYNSIVTLNEDVTAKWSDVENTYKRRADLIPNLVNTVKGYAKHEKETFTAVIDARSRATQITIDPSKLTAEKIKEFQAAQGEVTAALGKLMLLREAYPELKADRTFLKLQDELTGSENRIATARNRFIEATKEYNAKISRFPGKFFGFDKREYFEATEAEMVTPDVQF